MSVQRITTIDDVRVQPYRSLQRRRAAEDSGLFIAEGGLLFERLLASPYEIHSVVLSDRCEDRYLPRVPASVRTYVLPESITKELVGFDFHRGILTCGVRRPMFPCQKLTPPSGGWTIVVACLLQQDDNLGSLLRNCAAFGVDHVILNNSGPDPFGRRALRTAMGTTFNLELVSTLNWRQDLNRLFTEYDVEIWGTVVDASVESLVESTPSRRMGVIFGAEDAGIDAETAKHCQRYVTIPMKSGTDSLNVAVTSGIVLYHFTTLARRLS